MSTAPGPIPAFDHLQEVNALGAEALQRLSDEWMESPLAKKHRVKKLVIRDKDGRAVIEDLGIEVQHDATRDSLEPHVLHFPVDDLVNYIIERGIASPETRLKLKQIVRARRKRAGEAYQRFKSLTPRRLFVKCKNPACRRVFETQYTILPDQSFGGEFEPFTCPACGDTHPLLPADFFTQDCPEERKVELKGSTGGEEKPFSITIAWTPSVLPRIAPLVGRINDVEFEGHPAETVLFFGPEGSSQMPLGRLYFLYRDQSFNKLFDKETGTWRSVHHQSTNKTLYELADFSVLSSLKVDAMAAERSETKP